MSSNLSLYEKHVSSCTVTAAAAIGAIVLLVDGASGIMLGTCILCFLNLVIIAGLLAMHNGEISSMVKIAGGLLLASSMIGVILILVDSDAGSSTQALSSNPHILLWLSFWFVILMAGSFVAKHFMGVKRHHGSNLLGQMLTQLTFAVILIYFLVETSTSDVKIIISLVLALIGLLITIVDFATGKNMSEKTLKGMHFLLLCIWLVQAGYFATGLLLLLLALQELVLSVFLLRSYLKL